MEENFNKWAFQFYQKGEGLNKGYEKYWLRDMFLEKYPQYRAELKMRKFKTMLIEFAESDGFEFNPHTKNSKDKRDKGGSHEYFFVCNHLFDAARIIRYKKEDNA